MTDPGDRRTRSGELYSDLNKRRGKLSAEARRKHRYMRAEWAREDRARTLATNSARIRMDEALGAGFHLHIARTVLLALRDPTPGMVEAARYCLDDANRWRAMVDVAVRELDR